MAQVHDVDETAEKWFAKGSDGGRPVRYLVGAITSDVARKCRRRSLGGMKSRALAGSEAADAMDRAERQTLEEACAALKATENFSVLVGNAAAVEFYSKQLEGKALKVRDEHGALVPLTRALKAGDDLLMDGLWNDAIKRVVLAKGATQRADISEWGRSLVEGGLEEEADQKKDF